MIALETWLTSEISIDDLLDATAQRHPESPAIVFNDEYITFNELNRRVNRLAAHLRSCWTGQSPRVALILPNCPELIVGLFGTLRAGLTAMFIDPTLGLTATRNIIQSYNIACVLASEKKSVIIASNQNKTPGEVIVFGTTRDGDTGFRRIESADEDRAPAEGNQYSGDEVFRARKANEIALLVGTSGSSGAQKYVVLSHRNIVANVRSNIATLGRALSSPVLICLPLWHLQALTTQMITQIALGGTAVIMHDLFVPNTFLHHIERYRITSASLVPTQLAILAKFRHLAKFDLSSLKYLFIGGAPCMSKLLETAGVLFRGVALLQAYGLTECAPRVLVMPPDAEVSKLGSLGLPLDGVSIRVVNEEGNEVGTSMVGELWVKGENVAQGYLGEPDNMGWQTEDGWFKTGDLVHRDRDGFVYFEGRKKNIIISGGRNIYPEKVEACLMEHAGIREAMVVGIHHALLQEVAWAIIVPADKRLDAVEVRNFLRDRLALYELPKRMTFVDRLPRTTNHKLKRNNF
jgi:long-chain acyl-CoA synthetase